MKTYKDLKLDIGFIDKYEEINKFFNDNKNIFLDKKKVISFDIETKDLSMNGNELLGFGIGFSKTRSRYISVRNLTYNQKKNIFKAFNKFKCKVVLHNAYFDISQLTYMFGVPIKWDYCTYIMAHALHSDILLFSEDKDKKNSLSLKELCKTYYPELYGYEDELNKAKKDIMKIKGITKQENFTYDMFLDETIFPYGNYDVLATYALYEGLLKEIKDYVRKGWAKLPYLLELKYNVTKVYIKAKVNGIKVDRKKILELNSEWKIITDSLLEEILKDERIVKVEALLYMKKYKNLINRRQEKFDNSLEEKQQKIKDGTYTKEKLQKSKDNIFKLTQKMLDNIEEDSKFNIKSSEHKKILFIDVMELTPIKYNKINKKGQKTPKTDKEFLEKYSHIPLVQKILEYSLYIKGVNGFLGVEDENQKNGLYWNTTDEYPINHPNSNLQGTITHRVAQNNINLQQLPSRGKLSELKKCIIPLKDNHRIVAMDYSSCELYILGALSQEPNFIEAIKHNLDLHSNMAYSVWGNDIMVDDKLEEEIKTLLNIENINFNDPQIHSLNSLNLPIEQKLLIIKELCGDTRYNAKSINFGTPYGIGAKGLADNMKKTKKEAEKMLNDYMSKNIKIKEYMDNNKDLLCENGYIEGEHGQRLYLPNSKGINWRELENWKYEDKKYILEELRKSTNYIIQSENAMIIYEALIRFDKKIEELGLQDKIYFMTSIYDAVYLSVDNSISDDYIKNLLKEIFEVQYKDDVYFRIDIETGKNFKELS